MHMTIAPPSTKPTTLLTEVNRAALFLDEVVPGWYKKIDLRRLDIASCQCCIIGQLYKGNPFLDYIRTIAGRSRFHRGYYTLARQYGSSFLWHRYAFLGGDSRTEEWRAEILSRRERT